VSAFYVSNVEQYLIQDGKEGAFYDNVALLPVTDASVFIRPYATRRGLPGLCGITSAVKMFKSGRIVSYNNDALSCN
jgi:hypothetical protein